MTVGDPFYVGRTGLLAFQRVLNTTSHNITNANTPGYSRQRVELATRYPTPSTQGFVGNGVKTPTTVRLYDQFAAEQVRSRESATAMFSAFTEFAKQVDNLIADEDASLAPALEDFFISVQGVADDPTSIPARDVMLTQAAALEDRFSTMNDWLSDLRVAANDRIANQVTQINGLAQSLATINKEVIVAKGLGGDQPPNDLYDTRDHVIDKLSKLINVTTLEQEDGTLNIYIGSGQSLVLGTRSMELAAQSDPNDPLNFQVAYKDSTVGNGIFPISNMLEGGDLGGMLDFRDEILIPAQKHMGRLALSIAITFNAQHRLGTDMFDNLGGDFWVEPGPIDAVQSYRNVPQFAGTLQATVASVPDLTTDEYQLTYLGGGNYDLYNLDTGVLTNLTAAVGPPLGLNLSPQVNGLQIDITANPNAGDVFFIRPTRQAARDFALDIDDPSLIAAASPLRTDATVTNLGNGKISEATITDTTDINFFTPVTIDFRRNPGPVPPMGANEYSTDGGGTWAAYNPAGTTVTGNGWTVDVSGDVWDSDVFTVQQNTSGVSDNTNARALADLQIQGTMISGNASYHDAYSNLVVIVGNRTHQADINLTAQEALLEQALEYKYSISGVNLDEEAANLLRYQQAYTASAQV
ncbi:MAG: flagellar hook-associated protein FlgK, partial [Gammaproteobacteria bacterium]|nr:flagellar hook-associated protein FlgK [Gammaproteobacteria bacterium]